MTAPDRTIAVGGTVRSFDFVTREKQCKTANYLEGEVIEVGNRSSQAGYLCYKILVTKDVRNGAAVDSRVG